MSGGRRFRTIWQPVLIGVTAVAGVVALVAAVAHDTDGATPARYLVGVVLLGSAGLRALALKVSHRGSPR